tara:strand:- start:967 stop:1554 length:588 start_codon:yes stop_codon:yes gene_type:complete
VTLLRKLFLLILCVLAGTLYSSFVFSGVKIKNYPNGQTRFEIGVNTDGLPNGLTKEYDVEGNLISEKKFQNGVRQGMSKMYYANGNLMTEWIYRKGVRHGIALGYYPNGIMKDHGIYLNGKLNGLSKKYYPSGRLKAEMVFREDLIQGVSRIYDEEGLLKVQSTYRDGRMIRRIAYDRKGNIIQNQEFDPLYKLP